MTEGVKYILEEETINSGGQLGGASGARRVVLVTSAATPPVVPTSIATPCAIREGGHAGLLRNCDGFVR